MAEWIMVIFTILIALFTFLALRVYRRIAWFTGAMETHSFLQVRLEASKMASENAQSIKLVWWDPDFKDPPNTPEHGKEAQVDEIYLYLPRKLRRNYNSCSNKLRRIFLGI